MGVFYIKEILISSFDMEVGGVERSLIGLLGNFDYSRYKIDLMLYRHQGELFPMLPQGPELLKEIPEYTTFRKPVTDVLKEGYCKIASARVAARYIAKIISSIHGYKESGYLAAQLGWRYSIRGLPSLKKEYDVAISYLWPHYFVGEKVKAKKKIAWIHTDYSSHEIDRNLDAQMWDRFHRIVAVSEACKAAFLKKYPQFEKRLVVIENISSTDLIRRMSEAGCHNEMANTMNHTKLLTVARLSYAKGVDDAVKACKKLLDEGYQIKWYVIGYGDEEKNIKDLINSLGVQNNFILLGKKINPYPYMKACDIYVQPSRYEGKAITVTEAQILGKPVVITNYPTSQSQLKDGIDGYICPMGVEGIIEGVKMLINNEGFRNRIAYNAQQGSYGKENEVEKIYRLILDTY